MFVNVAKRSIYSDPKKSAHASLLKAYREAFMIYLFERENLNECYIQQPKTSIQHLKVNMQKGFCKRYMRLMLWSNIAPFEFFWFLFRQEITICTLN
jgi:hypothetical protein